MTAQESTRTLIRHSRGPLAAAVGLALIALTLTSHAHAAAAKTAQSPCQSSPCRQLSGINSAV